MRYARIVIVGMFVLIGLTGCMNNSRYQTQWSSMGQTQYSRAQSMEICKLEANAAKSRGESNYRDSQKQRTLNCSGYGKTRSYGSTVHCTESVTTPTYGRGAQGVLGGALNRLREVGSGKDAYNREMQRCMAHYGWRKEKICVSNCGKSSSRVTNYGNKSPSPAQWAGEANCEKLRGMGATWDKEKKVCRTGVIK